MATKKDNCLFSKPEQVFTNKYMNFNLNHLGKHGDPTKNESCFWSNKTSENRRSINLNSGRKDFLWKKQDVASNFGKLSLYDMESKGDKSWKYNAKNDPTPDTLQLHIISYEEAIRTAAGSKSDNIKIDKKKNHIRSAFNSFTSLDHFEYPRVLEQQTMAPEVMQFIPFQSMATSAVTGPIVTPLTKNLLETVNELSLLYAGDNISKREFVRRLNDRSTQIGFRSTIDVYKASWMKRVKNAEKRFNKYGRLQFIDRQIVALQRRFDPTFCVQQPIPASNVSQNQAAISGQSSVPTQDQSTTSFSQILNRIDANFPRPAPSSTSSVVTAVGYDIYESVVSRRQPIDTAQISLSPSSKLYSQHSLQYQILTVLTTSSAPAMQLRLPKNLIVEISGLLNPNNHFDHKVAAYQPVISASIPTANLGAPEENREAAEFIMGDSFRLVLKCDENCKNYVCLSKECEPIALVSLPIRFNVTDCVATEDRPMVTVRSNQFQDARR